MGVWELRRIFARQLSHFTDIWEVDGIGEILGRQSGYLAQIFGWAGTLGRILSRHPDYFGIFGDLEMGGLEDVEGKER